MQSCIDSKVLGDIREGSYEETSSLRERAATEALPEDAVLIASFPEHSVFATSEMAYRVKFSEEDGELAVESAEKVPGVVVTENDADSYVGSMLEGTVKDLLEGTRIPRNRLQALMRMVESKSYWFSDYSHSMVEQLSAPSDWQEAYTSNKSDIRKSLHGSLAVLEAKVPRTRYGKLGSKLPDFQAELDESFSIMLRLLDEVAGNVIGLEVQGSPGYDFSVVDVAEKVANEARSLGECGEAVRRLAREGDLGALAEIHDALAERLKDLVIVEEFIVRSSQAQTPTEKENATQS
jgi:hypothetical protein